MEESRNLFSSFISSIFQTISSVIASCTFHVGSPASPSVLWLVQAVCRSSILLHWGLVNPLPAFNCFSLQLKHCSAPLDEIAFEWMCLLLHRFENTPEFPYHILPTHTILSPQSRRKQVFARVPKQRVKLNLLPAGDNYRQGPRHKTDERRAMFSPVLCVPSVLCFSGGYVALVWLTGRW